ncbi:MAG: helix-turn-helix domain-containing protein [Spirochaetes bacterium]|nr:helix-turn-helix domain-containing protein [Spirochaetota bacterium]
MVKYKAFKIYGPGDHIKDELEARNWTQKDLASIIGFSEKHINQIINNKKIITFEIAKLLSQAFGGSTQYWTNLDTNYRLKIEIEKEKKVEIKAKIFERMPIRDMIKKGWIADFGNDVEYLKKEVIKFWKKDDTDFSFMDTGILPNFRKSDKFSKYNENYAITWFEMAKNKCLNIDVCLYNTNKLLEIAENYNQYTILENGVISLIEDLYKAGVVFISLSHLPQTYIDAASFMIKNNPVIVYTIRYDRIDNFWFNIAHEIGHIVKHIKNNNDCYIDDNLNEASENIKEKEADEFANKIILKNKIVEAFRPYNQYISEKRIIEQSDILKISPAIIVGVLQHEKLLPKKNLNHFKVSISDKIPEMYVKG